MTGEEAIKLLKGEIHKAVPKSAITVRKHNSAIDVAIKALEKQMPKKPVLIFGEKVVAKHCPTCGAWINRTIRIKNDYKIICPQMQHCYNCGQAIDWKDE